MGGTSRDVNKDSGLKAKARAKDWTFKALQGQEQGLNVQSQGQDQGLDLQGQDHVH